MKKSVISILACILMVGVFFLGKQFGTEENAAISDKITAEDNTTPLEEIRTEEDAAEQKLNLSFDHNLKAFFSIPLEQGNYTSINCTGMENITIQIDGVPMDLEKALTEGHTSADEIVALARADDRQGICNEVAKTEKGVTHFIYYYENFRLYHVYDVYETPDGSKHMITGLSIYSIGFDPVFSPSLDESGKRIDYEDWGLEFTGSEADSKGITVMYTQSGGQQFGDLVVESYSLHGAVTTEPVWLPSGDTYWAEPSPAITLQHDGAYEFTLDLEAIYGSVPAGDYRLELRITDVYDPETVHPLTQNFYDTQYYSIKITVPAQIYDFS